MKVKQTFSLMSNFDMLELCAQGRNWFMHNKQTCIKWMNGQSSISLPYQYKRSRLMD